MSKISTIQECLLRKALNFSVEKVDKNCASQSAFYSNAEAQFVAELFPYIHLIFRRVFKKYKAPASAH
jgi:hypothetical protein